ncbi:MAG: MotA/TolQ/ExbB proton channel family protein [Stappiaceae bacterium]
MDLATIIGIIAGAGVVVGAIFVGGDITQFIDTPSVMIVFGGGLAATLIRFPLSGIMSAFVVGGKVAFTHKKTAPREMVEKISELSDLVRKNGPLGLENVDIDDKTLAKGVQYVADGYDADFIKDAMERERDLYLDRLMEGRRVFKALGDSAPAFGMIGTLVGLVQMLATMDDPSTIGPSMAIALLTTLYGALLSNLVCLPLVDKLDAKFDVESLNQTLVIDGVMQIRENKSPALIREMLIAYLPEKMRDDIVEAA